MQPQDAVVLLGVPCILWCIQLQPVIFTLLQRLPLEKLV